MNEILEHFPFTNACKNGKKCDDCEEASCELFWCNQCNVALCFECDSHLHHAKSSRSLHSRFLLYSITSLLLTSSHPNIGCVPSENQETNETKKYVKDLKILQPANGCQQTSAINKVDLVESNNRNLYKENEIILSLSPTKELEGFCSISSLNCGNDGCSIDLCQTTPLFTNFNDSSVIEDSLLEESDTSSSLETRSSIYKAKTRPIKTALVLEHKQNGQGPHPKMNVKWHPEVIDPICSSISHTVRQGHDNTVCFSHCGYQKHLCQRTKSSSTLQYRKKAGTTYKMRKQIDRASVQPPSKACKVVKKLKKPALSHDSSFNENLCYDSESDLSLDPQIKEVVLVKLLKNNCVDTNEMICNKEVKIIGKNELYQSNFKQRMDNGLLQESEKQNIVDELGCVVPKLEASNKSLKYIEATQDHIDEMSTNSEVFSSSLQTSKVNASSLLPKAKKLMLLQKNKDKANQELVHKTTLLPSNRKISEKEDLACESSLELYQENCNLVLKHLDKVDESIALNFPKSCQSAIACMHDAAKMSVEGNSSGAMVEYEAAARLFREAEKNASHLGKDSARQAVQGQVAAWVSVAALYSQKGDICRAEQCHLVVLRACQASGLKLDAGKCLLEAGKCQLRRGECKRAHGLFTSAALLFTAVGADGGAAREGRVGTKLEVDVVDDTELQELVVKSDRLAGAAALQGRDVDVGKKLLLGALVSARRLHFKAEEARCLRLLANLQKGEPHLKSLQAAVDGFSVCNLPYEHAEALLCLATLKTTKYGNGTVTNESLFRVLPSGDMQRAFFVSAKQDLEAAASLLQPTLATKDSKHDLTDAKHAQSRSATPDAAATKRPRAKLCVEECGTLCNSSIALELLGRIHKACARACILIGEFEDARTYLARALKNREWVSACKSEVTLARALLDRLEEGPEP